MDDGLQSSRVSTLLHSRLAWWVAADVLTSIPPRLRYDVALLYLQQVDWDLDAAVDAYREDERWEREHPLAAMEKVKKGKSAKSAGMRRFVGASSSAGPR